MTRNAGIVRSAATLRLAAAGLETFRPADEEEANLVAVSRALVHAALRREESRGTHTRADFPRMSDECRGRFAYVNGGSDSTFVPLMAQPAGVP